MPLEPPVWDSHYAGQRHRVSGVRSESRSHAALAHCCQQKQLQMPPGGADPAGVSQVTLQGYGFHTSSCVPPLSFPQGPEEQVQRPPAMALFQKHSESHYILCSKTRLLPVRVIVPPSSAQMLVEVSKYKFITFLKLTKILKTTETTAPPPPGPAPDVLLQSKTQAPPRGPGTTRPGAACSGLLPPWAHTRPGPSPDPPKSFKF